MSINHDWLDYLAGFSGLVGGIAAVVALIFAVLSKRDAERSAAAAEATERRAEEQVEIMRREAAAAEEERGRRAAPEVHVSAAPLIDETGALSVLVIVGVGNENGTREVDRAVVNFLVPSVMQMRTASDAYGNPGGTGTVKEYPIAVLGDHQGALIWREVFGPLDIASATSGSWS